MANTIETKRINNVNMFIDGNNAFIIIEYFVSKNSLASLELGRRSKEQVAEFYTGLINAIYDGEAKVVLPEGDELVEMYVPEPEPEVVKDAATENEQMSIEDIVPTSPIEGLKPNEYGVYKTVDGFYINEDGESTDEKGNLLDEEGNIINEGDNE